MGFMTRHTLTMAALVVLLAATFHAQAPPTKATQPLPRTPWGHPDLQGRWTNATVTPLERPADLGAKEFFTESEAEFVARASHGPAPPCGAPHKARSNDSQEEAI